MRIQLIVTALILSFLTGCGRPATPGGLQTQAVETGSAENAEVEAQTEQAVGTGSAAETEAETQTEPAVETEPADETEAGAQTEQDENEEQMGTVKELEFYRDGMKIYGRLHLPGGAGPFPTVILAHGYAANLSMMEGYAVSFAKHGIAAYAFDFIGGGNDIKSDGTTSEMSVLTEAADMSAVLDGILALDEVDKDNVFLMGGSQGGFVATYVAAKRCEQVKGLIALYPAYVLQDDAIKRTDNGTHVTEKYNFMGIDIGRKYDEDAISFDIFDVMKDYTGRTLIVHGTADTVAPYSYSERAVKIMPSAELVTIEGAGHVFFGKADETATKCVIDFVRSVSGTEHE